MKTMKVFMKSTLWIVIALASCSQVPKEKPNIVMIYVDDWAWNGSPVAMDDAMENSRMPVLQMPNVQRLAEQGMKFRNAYGSCLCADRPVLSTQRIHGLSGGI